MNHSVLLFFSSLIFFPQQLPTTLCTAPPVSRAPPFGQLAAPDRAPPLPGRPAPFPIYPSPAALCPPPAMCRHPSPAACHRPCASPWRARPWLRLARRPPPAMRLPVLPAVVSGCARAARPWLPWPLRHPPPEPSSSGLPRPRVMQLAKVPPIWRATLWRALRIGRWRMGHPGHPAEEEVWGSRRRQEHGASRHTRLPSRENRGVICKYGM
jgi:hypothetical protein